MLIFRDIVLLECGDLYILSEYLFESLKFIHVFGFIGDIGLFDIVEGVESRGRFIFISF